LSSIDIKAYGIADSFVLFANAKLLKLSSGLELKESEIVINFVFEIK